MTLLEPRRVLGVNASRCYQGEPLRATAESHGAPLLYQKHCGDATSWAHPEALNEPFFSPGSAIRSVHNEGVLLLGGGRALLLQLAHPAVAAGVAAHSSYSVRRYERLLDTIRSTLAMIYGTREQALSAARRINGLHGRVHGPGYDARDPALLLWVLSTLVETTVVVHERFVRPLTAAEEAAYYEDILTLAPLLGLPRATMPSTLQGLHEYFEATLETLHVTDEARSICTELFRANLGLQAPMPIAGQLAAGLLPPRIRDEYGLSWGPRRESMLSALAWMCRRTLPVLPPALRRMPGFLLPPGSTTSRSV